VPTWLSDDLLELNPHHHRRQHHDGSGPDHHRSPQPQRHCYLLWQPLHGRQPVGQRVLCLAGEHTRCASAERPHGYCRRQGCPGPVLHVDVSRLSCVGERWERWEKWDGRLIAHSDTFAKIPRIESTLADIRRANKAGGNYAGQFVVYDLPDRDCAAAASNGEYSIADGGEAKYRNYIDTIKAVLQRYPWLWEQARALKRRLR